MADKKTGSKTNLNESALPLLDDPEKGETPEKEEKIELETKGGDSEKTDEKTEKDGKKKSKKEKKPKEPKEKKPRTTPLAYATNFTVGLNVLDRDEKKINEHVNLTFEDLIGETDANQGFEFIWRLTFLLFNFTKFWLYRIIAALLAIPLALLWAVVFALVNVIAVWGCTPSFKLYEILLHHVHRAFNGLVRTFLDPLFTSAGLLFGNIRTRHETHSTGVPTTTV